MFRPPFVLIEAVPQKIGLGDKISKRGRKCPQAKASAALEIESLPAFGR